MKRLTRENQREPTHSAKDDPNETTPGFLEWKDFPGRLNWKLGWWVTDATWAKDAKKTANRMYGVVEPANFVNVEQGQARKNDWFLLFKFPSVTDISWMRTEFVIIVDPSDRAAFDKDYPFQAVQANSLRSCPLPPFKLDQAFRSAFKKAVRTFGAERIKGLKSLRPPRKLLNSISDYMQIS